MRIKPRGRGVEGQRLAALQRDAAIKEEIEKDRVKSAANTARLRALRLAKEAANKTDGEKTAKAPVKRRGRRFGWAADARE